MKYQIKHRYNNSVLFETEADSMKLALIAATRSDSDLRGADLRGANLKGANLRRADLMDANLRGADLMGANLRGANLMDADLRCANLMDANLRGANLVDADLMDANLMDADLMGVNLKGANLMDANLRGAKNIPDKYFTLCRDDLWSVLSGQPNEVNGLRDAVIAGKINGSTYEGECACLVGTLAKVARKNHNNLDTVKPDSSRPIERFFLQIREGHTPDNHKPSKMVLEWIDEWIENVERYQSVTEIKRMDPNTQ